MAPTDPTACSLYAEFTVEPFVPGQIGRHVQAAIEAAIGQGAVVDVGPFGNAVHADTAEAVLASVIAALRAAIANGATRFSLQVDTAPIA